LPVKKNVSYNLHMKKVGEYLKEKREGREMSLREAATAAGLSHVHVKDIEEGKKSPSFDKVMALLRAYHADVQDFLRGTGFLQNVEPAGLEGLKRVPILSWTQAGHWREMSEQKAEEYVETDTKGVFALKVAGDSMEPEFYAGDIVIINPYIKQEHGDFVVVANDEGEATLKQLKKYGNTRVLHPLNSKYEDIELKKDVEYRIIGVVVEKKKRYR
jgi:SOS-response transcriptional repressor LexA